MIDLIVSLLNDNQLCIRENDQKIELFRGLNICYPEDYVELEREQLTDKFIVAEVHRDKREIKASTRIEEEAIIYAVVLYKRLFENIVDRSKAKIIMDYVDRGEDKEALACAIDSFDDSLYTIGYEEESKISLMQKMDTIDVKFDGHYIVQRVTPKRGYIVFFNYCTKLKYISEFCDDIKKRLRCEANRDNIIKLYIFGII